jgi:dTDP-glucose 4,6-dehydratase
VRILLTGIAGFVGSHIMSHLLKNTDHQIVGIASFRHKGCPTRVTGDANYQADPSRVKLVTHDLAWPMTPALMDQVGEIDLVLNVASGSHVDRSITHPVEFARNNLESTMTVLELARKLKPRKFVQFSTDEVYGQCPVGELHKEWSPIVPSNPYAGSKAAQEAMAISYWRTYGVPLIITNTMNVFGENQDAEKFLPLIVNKAKTGETLKIHAYPGCKTAGSRFYIHARNVADALLFIADNVPAPLYPDVDMPARINIVGEREIDNEEFALKVAGYAGLKLNYELVDFHSSRPGHDCRYALDGSKLAKLGWKPPVTFEKSLKAAVESYL